MNLKFKNFSESWNRVKKSSRFHNTLMFLVFVAIAAIFWFIISLNDSVTETFRVKFQIANIPDSVTFITDPPSEIHVTLRDKGTNILRSGVVKKPMVSLNFHDYAHDGIFRLSASDLNAELKADLGGVATISSTSLDSLRLYYTTSPGKRVPVIVDSDVSAESGYMIQGEPKSEVKAVRIYSYRDEIDTVSAVYTKKLVKKNLSQSSDFSVPLRNIPHIKIVPSSVNVKVNVEPLVHKEVYVSVEVINTPANENLLLFPNRVPVSFFVPMSRFNEENYRIIVQVDYEDVKLTPNSKLPLRIVEHSRGLVNVSLMTDSVEYTLVRH
ncbi:MAG: YbbR-like domain-containing protein [Muribaculaceae bacterium]|nr:YbbR-like domain-containing protein [Muribaculaceae bacterium]